VGDFSVSKEVHLERENNQNYCNCKAHVLDKADPNDNSTSEDISTNRHRSASRLNTLNVENEDGFDIVPYDSDGLERMLGNFLKGRLSYQHCGSRIDFKNKGTWTTKETIIMTLKGSP